MLHELDAGANLSLLPDRRKKLIPYNSKAKMHKALPLPGAFPTVSSRIARMRALDPPLDFPDRSTRMSEEQTKDRDGMADAIATLAIIAIAVLAAVLWVSSRG